MNAPEVCRAAARRRSRSGRSVAVSGALLALVGLGLSGCSSSDDSLAAAAGAGNNRYVPGSGGIEQLPAGRRSAPLSLSGTTVVGTPWSSATDAAGKVLVVNVWGSWCPPCVEETPALQRTWAAYAAAAAPVAFIGIDTLEAPETGAAFLRAKGVTFPSLSDQASGGAPVLALAGRAPATPTTLVLDRQGRIAARVSGPVTEITLRTLIDGVLVEEGLTPLGSGTPGPTTPSTPSPSARP